MSGIYIHIPFCKQACSYCDFFFLTRQQLRQPFVDSLVEEILGYSNTKYSHAPVKSIYLGGGTPSLLTRQQLRQIFDALRSAFQLEPIEVTMELNPDDVTVDYLNMIREFGVDRASMGVQSFHEEILRFMHRAHSRDEAIAALEALHKAGFPSFTADLIYGNPGQSIGMLRKEIELLLEFNPPHISAYSLTVEPDTRLGKQVKLGRIQPPEDEDVAEQFDLVASTLLESGIEQYEVSNFAKPGKEAVHNSNYWNHENYLGFGPSAHSFWWDKEGAKRWKNRSDLKFYLEQDFIGMREDQEDLDLKTLAEERLMLGLRTKWGVELDQLKERYGYELNPAQLEWINYQSKSGMIENSSSSIKMTHEGLRISDLLIVDLLTKG
jgi:oxygen-independent coproporphyrinogen-3 oxidase